MKLDIVSLIAAFAAHAIQAESQRQELLKQNPDATWAQDDFNLPAALQFICEEIQAIKVKLDL